MRTILKAVGLSPAFLLAIVAVAAAHTGQVTHISCGELDASVTSFPQGQSVVTANVNYDGGAFTAVPNPTVITGPSADITQGWRAKDWASHKVGVYFSWTADGGSKTAVKYAYVSNCGPITAGPQGPAGPKGDPGVGYDCTGTAVPTGGAPAMCPGTPGANGKDGVTTTITIVKPGPKSCSVSRRSFLLTLPKDYRGLKNLRVNVAGKTSTMNVRNGKVGISLKGLRCGVYAVAIRHKHRRTVKRLYTVNAGNVTAYNVRLPSDPKPDSVSRG